MTTAQTGFTCADVSNMVVIFKSFNWLIDELCWRPHNIVIFCPAFIIHCIHSCMTWIWDHDLVIHKSFFCCHSPTMSKLSLYINIHFLRGIEGYWMMWKIGNLIWATWTVTMTCHNNDCCDNVNDSQRFRVMRWHILLHSIPNTSCFRLVFMLFLYMWHEVFYILWQVIIKHATRLQNSFILSVD